MTNIQPSNASTPAEPIAALHEGVQTVVRNGKLYAATMTHVKCASTICVSLIGLT